MQKIQGWAENTYSLFYTLICTATVQKIKFPYTSLVVTNIVRMAKSDHLHYYGRRMFHNHIFVTVITLFCVFHLQVAFMPYRVNGQYIMEGLASSFLFSMGGLGFIILDKSNAVGMSKLNRFLLLFLGFVCVLVSFFTCRVFMRMKLP